MVLKTDVRQLNIFCCDQISLKSRHPVIGYPALFISNLLRTDSIVSEQNVEPVGLGSLTELKSE